MIISAPFSEQQPTTQVDDRLDRQRLPIVPPYPEIRVWHLVYHLAPFRRNRIGLYYHLDKLRKYVSCFNGRRILSCMTGEGLLPIDHVRAHLPDPRSWQIIAAPNSALHEGTSIVPILEDLLHDVEGQAFLYAHGKGMSRPWGHDAQWIERLYDGTFGSFERMSFLLTRYPVVGPFLWRAWSDERRSANEGWMYPGTFFALRSDVLARMPWRELPVDSRYWLERLPGLLFHKRYLGNVSNAIFGDTADVEAAETNVAADAFESSGSSDDAFWARLDAALAGRRHFDIETKVR